jgi:GAF domain-containing protein
MMDVFAREVASLRADVAVRAILEDVCRVTSMGFAAVARVTDTRWIACHVVDKIEFGLEPGDELELKTTICDEIRESGLGVVIDNVRADPTWRTHHTPVLYGFESYISYPIVLDDGSVWGTLCAIDPEPRQLRAPAIIALFQDYAAKIAKRLA